jgi:hypothetical protein
MEKMHFQSIPSGSNGGRREAVTRCRRISVAMTEKGKAINAPPALVPYLPVLSPVSTQSMVRASLFPR